MDITNISVNEKSKKEVLPPVSHFEHKSPYITFEDVQMEKSLREYIDNDKFPIPVNDDREMYYAKYHYDYWLSGLKDYLLIQQALTKQGIKKNQLSTFFELGCASGRVLRHFLCQESNLEIWGCDIKLSHVDWILKHLNSSSKVFQNSILPHLPIPDNYISLLCAFSVFTHIDEFELAWLAEVRRILKPGGIAYITLHTDHTWKILKRNRNPNIGVYKTLIELNDFIEDYDVTPNFLNAPMPEERMVLKWKKLASVYNCNVFHSTNYIHDVWGRFFDIVEIITEGHSDFQDVVILRKPEDA